MKLQVLFLEMGQEERSYSDMFREHACLCPGCDFVFKRDLDCIPGIPRIVPARELCWSAPQAVSSPSSTSRHLNRFQVSLKKITATIFDIVKTKSDFFFLS